MTQLKKDFKERKKKKPKLNYNIISNKKGISTVENTANEVDNKFMNEN